ncbi:uncharacterized protein LOC117585493 [Drosophila guanche]|uniref:MAD2L1-binding protein n=1 Tax=Drosophila guanche TaxID=7266 RepID=A0A3B0K465_DROGU|nr:uncharacterized protein LOC117585493 [Drosophila guanche]SPP82770.1 Hypothetical predicted protein [Drosophila guanche]
MDQNVKNIDLRLDNVAVLTTGTAAEFVNGILDFLLYQRSQIPFVYKMYKHCIDKWEDEEDTNQQESFANYQVNQQRTKARATRQSISDMREIIRQAFKSAKVKSLRFIFGSNTFLPTEVYTLHIPHAAVTRDHYHENHALSEDSIRQALLRLLTCEELYTIFSTQLNATNVFLELELLTANEPGLHTSLVPKAVASHLPRSCKNVHLHLLHASDNTPAEVRCCQELAIYRDLGLMQLDSSDEDGSKQLECVETIEESCGWWQSDVIVRGFKAPPNQKTCDLWSS